MRFESLVDQKNKKRDEIEEGMKKVINFVTLA